MNLDQYITCFSKEDEVFGEWIIRDKQMPFLKYSSMVSIFVEEFYDSELIDTDYNNTLEKFDIEDQNSWDELWKLRAMLTYIIRSERFGEGIILKNIENGTLLHILRKLKERI
jgi:hypothetical protein